MPETTGYLIVGAVPVSDRGADAGGSPGIRDHDPDGTIGLSARSPTRRTAVRRSRRRCGRARTESSVWRGTAELGVDLHLGRRAVVASTAPPGRSPTTAARRYGYEKLLLATGGRPRRLPGGGEDDDVVYFRHLPDYRRLRSLADAAAPRSSCSAAGSSAPRSPRRLSADGLRGDARLPRGRDRRPALPGRARGVGQRALPRRTGSSVHARRARRRGSSATAGASTSGSRAARVLEADAVVAGLGHRARRPSSPRRPGSTVSDGIVVDEYGRAGDTGDVYAAGRRRPLPVGGARDSTCGSSTRTRQTATAARSARTWPAPTSRTATCRSSTPTCSSSATRRWARSTRALETVAHWAEPIPQGRRRLPRRAAAAARVPARRRLGQGRRRDGADRRRASLSTEEALESLIELKSAGRPSS